MSRNPVYKLYILHDGENCFCSKAVVPAKLWEKALVEIMSSVLGDRDAAMAMNVKTQLKVKWDFVLKYSETNPNHPTMDFISHLRQQGGENVDPGVG